MSMDNSIALLNVTSGDENKKESQKITLLEENEILLRKQIGELQECLKEQEKKLKSVQEEQNKVIQLESEVSSLRRMIEIKIKDWTVTEEKALEIMKNIKDNFKKRENDVTIESKKCIDSKKQEITYLKEKLQSTQIDYEKKKKQLEKINEELEKREKLLLEYQERVNKNMNTLKTICTELEDQIHVLERLLETHQENESKLIKQKESCQNDIEKLEDDVRNTQETLAKEKRNRFELL
ncbi:sodium channel and clathrin linker 1-like isoform X2 [Centruroides sculpturatus]|uniref:sodium channel and clathrin linker 1-like isoform X2 n=1 Tax=Centruroides sculpturatus TaxID=218467 RepID=UPI000C6E9B19|nr:sodium channel and clathrin linker 1-like isoform X2 [Centruroides sculpturatus]